MQSGWRRAGRLARILLYKPGGWFNYALEAAACLSVLLGRGMSRIVTTAERPTWRWGMITMAAMVLLAADGRRVVNGIAFRRANRAEAVALMSHPLVANLLPEQRYFSGPIQHYNVWYGDRRLAHDEWLYSAFEAIGAAEPRTSWLGQVVGSGHVRLVVMVDESSEPKGLSGTLPQLGFTRAGQSGPFYLWTRGPRPDVATMTSPPQ